MKEKILQKELYSSGISPEMKQLMRQMESSCRREMEACRSGGRKLFREKIDMYRDLDALSMGSDEYTSIVEKDLQYHREEYQNDLTLRELDYQIMAAAIDEANKKKKDSLRVLREEERDFLQDRIDRIQKEVDAYERAENAKAEAKRRKVSDRMDQKAEKREYKALMKRIRYEMRAIREKARRDLLRDRMDSTALARKMNLENFRLKKEEVLLKLRLKIEEMKRRLERNDYEDKDREAV